MKKTLAALALVSSSSAFAVAPGGPDCGWGNMIFEGKSGLPSHLLASIVNGTSGNASFGMTSGTNGCSAEGTLTYGGVSLLGSIMDEFIEDVAQGQGEALTAMAVAMGIDAADRAEFAATAHSNFDKLFPNENVTAESVMSALLEVMSANERLAKYAA